MEKIRIVKHGNYLYAMEGNDRMASYSKITRKRIGATRYFPPLLQKAQELGWRLNIDGTHLLIHTTTLVRLELTDEQLESVKINGVDSTLDNINIKSLLPNGEWHQDNLIELDDDSIIFDQTETTIVTEEESRKLQQGMI